jgi:hypothetical protein
MTQVVGHGQKGKGQASPRKRPIRNRVRGKVVGDLPEQRTRIQVMFAGEVGALEPVGGAAATVQAGGRFECATLPGRCSLEVCEFSGPEPNGRRVWDEVNRFNLGKMSIIPLRLAVEWRCA